MLGTTGYSAIELQNDANGFYVARNGATADSFATGNTAYAGILAVQGNHNLEFATNGVVRQTINGSGNATFEGDVLVKGGELTLNSSSTVSNTSEIDKIVFRKQHPSAGANYNYDLGEIRSFTNGGYSGGLKFYTGKHTGGGNYASTLAMTLDASQNATFAGDVTVNGLLKGPSSIVSVDNRVKVIGSNHQLNIGQWDTVSHRIEGDANRPVHITSYQGHVYLGTSGNHKLDVHNGGISVTGTATAIDFIASAALRVGGNQRWKIRGNSDNQQLAFEYSTSGTLADSNIKLELNNNGDATLEGVAHIKKGITTDGNAKFYNWRALQNTSNSSNQYYRIARITGSQSTRFIIELAGRSTSYSDQTLPAYGKLVGQLNNDDNYDLTYYNHSTSNSEVVAHIGQVDVSATETDIYIKVGQFAEITAIAHISDGSITTYDSDSGSTTKPTGYVDPTLAKIWNTLNDGSGSGLDADKVDGIHGSSFLRSDANDTASGTYTFTGEARFALDSTWANSEVRLPATTDANPRIMFYRPTGSASTSYPWRFQAGGGGSSSSFYIGTGSSANNGSETISNKFSLSSTGTLTVSGDVIAYGSPSDAKYKENVKPIENALDKVMDLEGVSFDWKEGDDILDIKEDIGFIAQDVQKVIPELVRENEDGNLSLRYQGIIPVLLEAMKEQQKQIDELKSQMAACNQRACDCKK